MSKINPVVKEFPDGSELTALQIFGAGIVGAVVGVTPILLKDWMYSRQCRKDIAERQAREAERFQTS